MPATLSALLPLYIGYDADGKVYVGSELKALEGFCEDYEPFLPGHYYHSKEQKMKRWYTRDWMDYEAVKPTLPMYPMYMMPLKQLYIAN